MILTRDQANLAFLFIVVCLICGELSLFFTIFNTWSLHASFEGLVLRWLKGWALACLVALPTAAVLVPRVRRFTDSMVRK